MTDPLLIPCPHCNGLNRIPAARVGEHPKCGRCKGEVLLHKPFELKQGDYASQIKGDLPLLVDVWADWCGPCKMMAPIVEALSEELSDVKVCHINIDENIDIAQKYRVMSIPTFIAFKGGEESGRQIGAIPKTALVDLVK